jgi:hypothetical protein
MAAFTYKVAPFLGVLESGQTASTVASQLEQMINEHANQGWEFYQLNEVSIEVRPGCLGKFLGRESDYMRYDQLIFRRPMV